MPVGFIFLMSFHLAKKQLDFIRLKTKLSIRTRINLVTGYSPNKHIADTQSCADKTILKFRHEKYKRVEM